MFAENNENLDDDDEEDEEDEDYINDVLYEPEEMGLTKYTIVLCEKCDDPNHHYLTWYRFKKLDLGFINKCFEYINEREARLEIAECIYLPSQQCVSIIKTFWIRLIQRKWRNVCNERKRVIRLRCCPSALSYREIRGNDCAKYPILKGMLSDLGCYNVK